VNNEYLIGMLLDIVSHLEANEKVKTMTMKEEKREEEKK